MAFGEGAEVLPRRGDVQSAPKHQNRAKAVDRGGMMRAALAQLRSMASSDEHLRQQMAMRADRTLSGRPTRQGDAIEQKLQAAVV